MLFRWQCQFQSLSNLRQKMTHKQNGTLLFCLDMTNTWKFLTSSAGTILGAGKATPIRASNFYIDVLRSISSCNAHPHHAFLKLFFFLPGPDRVCIGGASWTFCHFSALQKIFFDLAKQVERATAEVLGGLVSFCITVVLSMFLTLSLFLFSSL